MLCEYMHDNPLLETLEILDEVTAVGCTILSKHFQDAGPKSILHTLILDHNEIGDDGAIQLSFGLKCYDKLKILSLNYCHIGATGGVSLFA